MRLRLFLGVQAAIPLVLLLARFSSGEVEWYGWGWQMFS